MKQLFLILFLIGNGAFANDSQGQIDTLAINRFSVQIFDAFKNNSAEQYQQVLMSKTDYRNIIRKTKWDLFPKNKFKQGYNFIIKKAERQFDLVTQKGKYQGIDWSNIELEKVVFHSEETQLINQAESEPAGFLVKCHLVFKVDNIYYTIVGMELLKCGKDYKMYHSPEGVYPVRLSEYIATESIDIELEENKNGTN